MKNKLAQKIKLGAALLLMAGTSAFAQTSNQIYTPTPENIKARQEFQDNKFGIFLHWGIYSMTAQGEWYMNTHNINRNEYAKLASGFYPSRFDAAEWVSAIKTSGAKYICITSRHHDSFSMFDTKESDFNIVDATPFKRDILKELAEECQKQGIKLHFYYSHLDWFRDDYPEGNTGHGTGRPKGHGNWASYYKFMNKQLTELLTNYGPVGAIWFDGIWDQPTNFNWQLEEQYALIHKLQPSCLIGNNHHRTPYAGEDFQMFERDLPGENKAGFSAGQGISELPLETCETMNGMWGYRIEDQNYKSPKELIHYLVKAAGKNANLLMNIGPQPNGELPATAVEHLKQVGKWMNTKVAHLGVKRFHHYAALLTDNVSSPTGEAGVIVRSADIAYASATTAPRRLKHSLTAVTLHCLRHALHRLAITALPHQSIMAIDQDGQQLACRKPAAAHLTYCGKHFVRRHACGKGAVGTQKLILKSDVPSPRINNKIVNEGRQAFKVSQRHESHVVRIFPDMADRL